MRCKSVESEDWKCSGEVTTEKLGGEIVAICSARNKSVAMENVEVVVVQRGSKVLSFSEEVDKIAQYCAICLSDNPLTHHQRLTLLGLGIRVYVGIPYV